MIWLGEGNMEGSQRVEAKEKKWSTARWQRLGG